MMTAAFVVSSLIAGMATFGPNWALEDL